MEEQSISNMEKAFKWQAWNTIINAVRQAKGLTLYPRNNPYLSAANKNNRQPEAVITKGADSDVEKEI